MKQELMICPKRKECKKVCIHKQKHTKCKICNINLPACPKCVPYRPKPRSMFAGLRKGDRVEIEADLMCNMVYYISVDSLRLWYKINSKSEDLFCFNKSKIKSIKKLAVKK